MADTIEKKTRTKLTERQRQEIGQRLELDTDYYKLDTKEQQRKVLDSKVNAEWLKLEMQKIGIEIDMANAKTIADMWTKTMQAIGAIGAAGQISSGRERMQEKQHRHERSLDRQRRSKR